MLNDKLNWEGVWKKSIGGRGVHHLHTTGHININKAFMYSSVAFLNIAHSEYAVKVRRHNSWSHGPLSWIPGMWFTQCKFRNLQHCCSCALGMCEPRNRDNGASDLWTLTAYNGQYVAISQQIVWNRIAMNCKEKSHSVTRA